MGKMTSWNRWRRRRQRKQQNYFHRDLAAQLRRRGVVDSNLGEITSVQVISSDPGTGDVIGVVFTRRPQPPAAPRDGVLSIVQPTAGARLFMLPGGEDGGSAA